jgi:hypothetical protein
MVMRDKPVSHLILILFVSAIGGSVVGESLRLILRFIAEDTIVEKALLNYISYDVGPHMLNLIILSFQFALTLNFNVMTLLGIFVGWYYFKYSY